MQNPKANDHLISYSVFSRQLVPKKGIMLPREKPWLLPNMHNIFLDIVGKKQDVQRLMAKMMTVKIISMMKIMFTTGKSISIKQNSNSYGLHHRNPKFLCLWDMLLPKAITESNNKHAIRASLIKIY